MFGKKGCFVDQETAKKLDERLMAEHAFSIDQLMELAGLSVAMAVHDYRRTPCRILVICGMQGEEPSVFRAYLVGIGPGNNGGDGLVAARHLCQFGYDVSVFYPKVPRHQDLFARLVKQCKARSIKFIAHFTEDTDLFLDAIFGFSFKGPIRSPYDQIIGKLQQTSVPIISIDIPSGWDVEEGPGPDCFHPVVLISLSAPKLCAAHFAGVHYVGGRFIPPQLARELSLEVPTYEGSSQIRRIA